MSRFGGEEKRRRTDASFYCEMTLKCERICRLRIELSSYWVYRADILYIERMTGCSIASGFSILEPRKEQKFKVVILSSTYLRGK